MQTLNHDTLDDILIYYKEKAKIIFNFNASIELQIDLKGHRLIGQCCKIAPNHYKIRLHVNLTEKYKEIYLHDVIPHELAHAVIMEQVKHRVKPHGKEYKAVLAALEGIGYLIILAALGWFIYRITKGWLRLLEDRPMD